MLPAHGVWLSLSFGEPTDARPECPRQLHRSGASSRSNSFLLIDTTGTAHPRGSSNPGQCHVNFAEGCHLYIAVTLDGKQDPLYGKFTPDQQIAPGRGPALELIITHFCRKPCIALCSQLFKRNIDLSKI